MMPSAYVFGVRVPFMATRFVRNDNDHRIRARDMKCRACARTACSCSEAGK